MLHGPDCPCGGGRLRLTANFDAPPLGETVYALSAPYTRQLWCCTLCGHYVNRHNVDMEAVYSGAYVEATYGATLRHTFKRITTLPPELSDNEGRVQRVLRLTQEYFAADTPLRILDVGSGLCVFLYRLQREGWHCTALDPDTRAVEHARSVAGVNALHANFLTDDVRSLLRMQGFTESFDVISFNKVLEHVQDPIKMLHNAHFLLKKGGLLYMELPDGERATHDIRGYEHEEFHLEHWHVFSMASACLMVHGAGFTVRSAGRLRDPSGKYTLWATATL